MNSGAARTWATALPLAGLVIALPICFGVAFPASLAAMELTAFLLFAAQLTFQPQERRHLVAILAFTLGFLCHVVALGGDMSALDPAAGWLSEATHDSTIDTAAAVDSFRRGLAYLLLFILASRIATRAATRSLLVGAIAISGALLLVLGMVTPRDSQDLLWLFALPVSDLHWLSLSADNLQSSMFGYLRTFDVAGIPLPVDARQTSRLPVGPILNQNQFVAAVGVTFPVLLSWVGRKIARHISIGQPWFLATIAALVCVAVVLLTHSRGGALALAASMIGFFLASAPRTAAYTRIYFAGVVVAAAGVSIVATALQASGTLEVASGRSAVWYKTVQTVVDQPLFGVGLGNFQDLGITLDATPPSRWYAAHNVLLQAVVEIGLAGILWLAVVGCLLTTWRRAEDSEDGRYDYAGLYASLVFALAHSAVDYSPTMPFNAVTIAVVCALFLARSPVTKLALAALPQNTGDVLLASLVAIVVIIIGVNSFRNAQIEWRMASLKVLNERWLSGSEDRDPLERTLQETLETLPRSCKHPTLRKETIRALANAHLILSRGQVGESLRSAAACFERYQSLGRRDTSLLATQAALAKRLGPTAAKTPGPKPYTLLR